MFRISRRLDYGVQLMSALAKEQNGRALATAVMSQRLGIPLPFLHQIGRSLIQGGLIKATPGPHGGLRLNGNPYEISLLQIVEILEGPIRIMPEPPETGMESPIKGTWEELQEKLVAYLSGITLGQLIDGSA